jgi:hypothetical protein
MIKDKALRRFLGSLGVAVAVLGAASGVSGQDPLRALLPSGQAVPGWTADGDPQAFEGEDLYTYIDGGAEIYQEYGFRRVVVQDFKNPKGKSVSIEIFEMTTPTAAYGIFSFKRSGNGKIVPLGSEAELESYYLNVWRGRYLVTVTGFDESPETAEGLLAIASAVAAKIREEAPVPSLVAALPEKGLRPGSVKYLKGHLGLNNVYPLYTARGLEFTEAVRGLYDSGETLIVLDYGSAEARHAAWLELRTELERSGRFEQPKNYLADAVVFKDGKGQYLAFGEAGARLAIGIHSTLEWALTTVARVR